MSFRRILLVALAIGAVVAVRNATANKGGSYDPASEAGDRGTTPFSDR